MKYVDEFRARDLIAKTGEEIRRLEKRVAAGLARHVRGVTIDVMAT